MKLRHLFLILPLLLVGVSCNRDPKIVSRKYVENGNKYFNTGKFKEASIMYRNALKKDPRNGDAYYRLGLCDLRMGQPGVATRSLRRAVELMPDNLEAQLTLADIYLMAVAYDAPQRQGDFAGSRGTGLRNWKRRTSTRGTGSWGCII